MVSQKAVFFIVADVEILLYILGRKGIITVEEQGYTHMCIYAYS
jgi:hypothetical protein